MKPGNPEKTRTGLSPLVWAEIIFVIAFLARLLHLLTIQTTPLFTYLAPDPLFYYQLGSHLAVNQPIGDLILFKAPLYPYLLALFWKLFGLSLFVPLIVQDVVGAFVCVMIYVLARRFYANKIAVTAGMVAALYGPLILFGNELLPFNLALGLNLAAIWLLITYEDDRKKKWLILAGLAIGLSATAHPAILLFVPIVVLWLHQRLSKNRQDWLRQAAPFILGLLIVLVPLAVHNLIAGSESVVYSTYGGVNFAAGNNEQADGGSPALTGGAPDSRQGVAAAQELAKQLTGKELSAVATGGYWLKQGFGFILSHPLQWIGLELRKLANLVAGHEIPKDKQIYFFAARSSVLQPLLWEKIIAFPFGVLLPLAFLAPLAIVPLRRERRQCVPIGYVLANIAIMLLFTVTARYRAMVIPIVAIWGAAGFWGLVALFRAGDYKKFYRSLVLLLFALIVVNGIAYIPAFSSRSDSDFDGYMFSGSAYFSAGNYADAEKEFYQAATLNPRSPAAFINLGNVFVQQGKDSLAVDYYRRAISAEPKDDRAKQLLAQVYHRRNRIKELNELVAYELKSNPKAVWALHEYAFVHEAVQEYDLAAEYYEEAFQADSTDYEAIFLKANCYLTADMRMEAVETYQRFLKYVPNSVEGHANLGQVYARQNKYDLALKQFNWVVKAQPGNPAGYFNLASTYLQMGEFDKADERLNKARKRIPTSPASIDCDK